MKKLLKKQFVWVLLLSSMVFGAGSAKGWQIYDGGSSGASIEKYDVLWGKENAVRFSGGLDSGYILGYWENCADAWNDTLHNKIQWSMRFDEERYNIFIRVMTTEGARYLYYTPDEKSIGKIGQYIHIGLGHTSVFWYPLKYSSGSYMPPEYPDYWMTIRRDLQDDLRTVEPTNSIIAINAILVRGSGAISDVKRVSNIKCNPSIPITRAELIDRIYNQEDVTQCNTSEITDMSELFYFGYGSLVVRNFNQDISNWDVSNVINMHNMFRYAEAFNQDISNWDVSNVTDMRGMFYEAKSFNQPLDTWDVSRVDSMRRMFGKAEAFNQDISNWDVSNVTDMKEMFKEAKSFNQPLNTWDVSSLNSIIGMFNGASAFNQDISNWDVSSVTDMQEMFKEAKSFNQPLNTWDVSSLNSIIGMFNGASAFNQDISNWDVSNVTDMQEMFKGAKSFNQPLNTWDVSSLNSIIGMFNGASAFNQDISNWELSRKVSYTKNRFSEESSLLDEYSPFNPECNPRIPITRNKLEFRIKQRLDVTECNTSQITDMSWLFAPGRYGYEYTTKYFNQNISGWDTSSVTNMAGMFAGLKSFNQALNSWDVSNVTNMYSMFRYTDTFNQALDSWDVSKVTRMDKMFANASAFKKDISSWNVTNVIEHSMFSLDSALRDEYNPFK